ncbi:MAG: RecBCD enzyme subunit RecD [Firmicutes bacterium ADurb.Bin182]|nr:MAG: RecBCD enzyme subunit RecD [Firmicutes bacterium ADurb.Bin182]
MTDFEKNIYQIIADTNGIKGSEIAAKLGVEKRTVNSTLANSTTLKAVVKQESDFKWYLINTQRTGSKKTVTAPPKPDEDLRKHCYYYLNCLSLESSSSVSQFLTSKFSLQYEVLNGLGLDSDNDKAALSLLYNISSSRDFKAYLGYPVRIFTIFGKDGTAYQKIAPVFLFPVEYNGGHAEISWLPSINMEVLKAFCDNNSNSLAIELVNLETELGMNTPDIDIEIDELVLRLKEIRQWDWKEIIDPYNIPRATDLSELPNGIYNRPIIIKASREKYTQGLEAELMVLANMPEESYKKTALYAWVKGRNATKQDEMLQPLLEVLPLNSEQAQSVETALRSELTIVTGPPGTGKSQVVTDLLINIVWNGKSALFSSKNNKAVDIVDARINGLCKRPVLLRIGNNQHAPRLAEIIEGLLNAKPTATDRTDMEFYSCTYNAKIAEANKLHNDKKTIVAARNALDGLEQKYCLVRELIDHCFDYANPMDVSKIEQAALIFKNAYHKARKDEQNFFMKLFWFCIGPGRITSCEKAAGDYNVYASRYKLSLAKTNLSNAEVSQLASDAGKFDKALSIATEYKIALQKFKSFETLENIDRSLLNIKSDLAEIAFKLWNKWLISQAATFSASERQEMSNFVAAMKLAGDVDLSDNPDLKRQFSRLSQQMTKYLQCWAVTSLSAKSRVPFLAGVFDYVIIDEASQCDIASILPLLYRAKRAVIIGDPKQLSHISQLSRQQDLALLQKYNVQPAWSYSTNSLYALAAGKVEPEDIVQLKDHFRSCADIIEFSNEVFYDGSLRTATKYTGLKTPEGEKPGIRWINVSGKIIRPSTGSAYNDEEAVAVVKELKRLVNAGYAGSIGVTTPFRLQAERIKSALENTEPRLYDILLRDHEFIADTVHKFQGDERDLMIFSSVVTQGTPNSTLGFLNSTGNLFNVAITRARAVLVVIGDYRYCTKCNISYLNKFSDYYDKLIAGERKNQKITSIPDSRDYPWVANPEQVSVWEKVLYIALHDAGIQSIPQYPVDKYKLDFALILNNDKKLDIEVDGAMYHRKWNGELCYRDQIRNQRLFELGWDVKRFWVCQIRDDMPWCIQQIKEWCKN